MNAMRRAAPVLVVVAATVGLVRLARVRQEGRPVGAAGHEAPPSAAPIGVPPPAAVPPPAVPPEPRDREAQTILPPAPVVQPSETTAVAPVAQVAPSPLATSASGDRLSQEGRGESYWRSRMESARARITRLQAEVAQLDPKATQTAYGSTEPSCFLPTLVTREAQNAYYECLKRKQNWPLTHKGEREEVMSRLARAREELSAAQRALSDLEEEARRAGALPGWLR